MVDKRPIGYIPGKGNPLDKKPPKSKKYDHIQSILTTGPTIKDINVISDSALAKRRNELFKRIKTSTLSGLVKQERNFESIYNLADENRDQQGFDSLSMASGHSVPVSIRSQATQVSAITYATERLGITDDTCFLLLDLREPDEFMQYHIKESINMPAPNVSRDKFPPQVYRFKNQTDKLIIIYHIDERNGIPVATKFAEKGFENVFLLSGGIEKFLQEFPDEVEGNNVPIRVVESDTRSQKSKLTTGRKTEISSVSGTQQKRASSSSQIQQSLISQKGTYNQNPSRILDQGSIQSKIPRQTPIKSKLDGQNSVDQSRIGGYSSGVSRNSFQNASSALSRAGGQIVGGNSSVPQKIVKRSNYKEYPEHADVQIQKDLKEEREIQRVINNSALKQSIGQNSPPRLQNDSIFSIDDHNFKK